MTQSEQRDAGEPAPSVLGPRLVAIFLVALGALVFYEALQVRSPAGFSPLGPRFVPLVVAVGLVALGALFLVRTTWRVDDDLARKAGNEEAAAHWATLALIGVALIVYAFALAPLGYLLATAILIPVAARILGSDHWVRDTLVGVAVSAAIYVGFTELLGVRLPAGILGLVL